MHAATAAESESWLLLSMDAAPLRLPCQPNSEDPRVHWLGDEAFEFVPKLARRLIFGPSASVCGENNTLLEELLAFGEERSAVVISGDVSAVLVPECVLPAWQGVEGIDIPDTVLPEKCCSAVVCVRAPNVPVPSNPSDICLEVTWLQMDCGW